jgi:hypothetical protein
MEKMMLKRLGSCSAFVLLLLAASPAKAQLGNSGSIEGVVKDPSGGVVVGAAVEINNPVTGFRRDATTSRDGAFRFTNIPFNPYHLSVAAPGFASAPQDVDVRSTVPMTLSISLQLGTAQTSINVEAKGEDLVEKDSTFHTDIDQAITDRLPIESATSSMSNMVLCWPRDLRQTRMVWPTDWAIMRKSPLPLTTSRSQINKARYFPTRSPRIPFNRWK